MAGGTPVRTPLCAERLDVAYIVRIPHRIFPGNRIDDYLLSVPAVHKGQSLIETPRDDGPESPASPVDRRATLRGLGEAGALAASLDGTRMAVARQDAGSQVPLSMEPNRTRAKRQ